MDLIPNAGGTAGSIPALGQRAQPPAAAPGPAGCGRLNLVVGRAAIAKASTVALLLLGGRYLVWRATATLNLESPLAATISLLALAAEALLLVSGGLELWFSLWLPNPATPGQPGPTAAAEVQQQPPAMPPEPADQMDRLQLAGAPSARPGAQPPSGVMAAAGAAPVPGLEVEVLVPSYGEPLALIEGCLRACLDLDHPRFRVWLLDDSGRPELRQLCARLGVHYRARRQRHHAKAGNLNHVLGQLRGELIAVFDADVMPLRSFLRCTVPLFADPAVGFVQTPQCYRTADPVMRNLGLERWLLPDEESFYRWIEPCREAVGALVCAGTSFVVRRKALEQVGGFETGTPSEDLATGIRITAAGYRNRYLPQKLSAGLAPLTAAAMARQRCRWASGTLQVLRTGANPLTIPGLRPLQRLAYLEGIVHWLMPLPQLLVALMPLSLGVLGIAPLRLSGAGLLQVALPFFAAQLLLIRWLSRQSRTALLPELYRWIFLMPLVAAVLLTLLGRPQRFRVTPKALVAGRRIRPAKRLVLPLLLLLSLQLVSLLNLLNPTLRPALARLSAATVAVSLIGSGLTLLLLALALRACLDRPGLSEQPWYSLALPGRLHSASGHRPVRLEAISELGVELRLGRAAAASVAADRQANGPAWQLELPGLPGPLPLLPQAWQERRLGAHWGPLAAEQRQALRRFLVGRDGLWPQRPAPSEALALPVVLARLLLGCRPEGWFRRSLMPQQPPAPGDR